MLVNEALLSVYFLAFVAITARLFTIYCEQFHSSFPKRMLRQGLGFNPQQNLFEEQLLSESPPSVVLEQELDNPYTTFLRGLVG